MKFSHSDNTVIHGWQGSFWLWDQPMGGNVMASPIDRAHTKYDP